MPHIPTGENNNNNKNNTGLLYPFYEFPHVLTAGMLHPIMMRESNFELTISDISFEVAIFLQKQTNFLLNVVLLTPLPPGALYHVTLCFLRLWNSQWGKGSMVTSCTNF